MFDPPALARDELEWIAGDVYGLAGTLAPLRGERDQNTRITTSAGERYVLKVGSPSADPSTALFHARALVHIASTDADLPVPRVLRTRAGELCGTVDVAAPGDLPAGSDTCTVQVLSFIPGIVFNDPDPVSLPGLRGIGAVQGRLARALVDFDDPAADNFMPWALDSGTLELDELWSNLSDAAAAVAGPCRDRVASATAALGGLRRQIVHNDGHRGNLLRADARSERVIGVIDFGDLVRTALVADLAIAAASFVGDQPDPIAGLCALARGFHGVVALEHDEIDVLPDLVLARMTLSTLMLDFQIAHTPHLAAALTAERPSVLSNLERWRDVDLLAATDRLRAALDQRDRGADPGEHDQGRRAQ